MTALPTPVLIPAGHVVRVRIGGQVYQSPVRPAAEARAMAEDLSGRLSQVRDGSSFIPFADEHGRTVSIRARAVTAVEVGPPPPRHDRPRDWSGDVHVHLGSSPTGDEVAAEPTWSWNEGDPDPTPNHLEKYCDVGDPSGYWKCSWGPDHRGDHVAGTGSTIVAVWSQS